MIDIDERIRAQNAVRHDSGPFEHHLSTFYEENGPGIPRFERSFAPAVGEELEHEGRRWRVTDRMASPPDHHHTTLWFVSVRPVEEARHG